MRVDVKESILRWAMERSRTSTAALRTRFPKIEQWLTGLVQPTMSQLEKFARATTTPFGMMFLDAPPDEELPIPHFRTVDDKTPHHPSADLLDTLYAMQRRQDWMREYVKEIGQQPLPFVGSASITQPVRDVASRMRQLLGFSETWASRFQTWEAALRAMRTSLEEAGFIAFSNGIVANNTHRALDPDEFRGFVLVDEFVPLVFVNAADVKVAQMFTLAHEFAHAFYGSSAAFDLRELMPAADKVEQACNRVAAEFLVPETQIAQSWPSVRDDEATRFYRLARQFKVSTIVVARRALDLGLISKEAFLNFYYARMKEEHSKPKPTGGDFYNSQPGRVGERFGAAIVQSVREGKTLYTEAYRLTDLHGSTFETFAADILA